MDDHVLVRELTPIEYARIGAKKTGETLADGSVLLRRQDMDHMGLNRFRSWIENEVLSKGSVLALFDETPRTALR